MRTIMLTGLMTLFACSLVAEPIEVKTVGSQSMTNSDSRIVAGTISLPGSGYWVIDDEQSDDVPIEIFLQLPEALQGRTMGRRMRKVESNRNVQRGRSRLSSVYWPVKRYAITNDAQGPVSIDLLPAKSTNHLQKSPWHGEYADVEGPFVFLVPRVPFRFRDDKRHFVPREQREILAFELRPFLDDGKHWVLYTDGLCERETIDLALLKLHGQVIRPVTNEVDHNRPPPAWNVYSVTAVLPNDVPASFTVKLSNNLIGEVVEATWRVDADAPIKSELTETLADLRANHWEFLAGITQSEILASWTRKPSGQGRQGRPVASVFGMLGGRPAIEETLQMGLLRASPDKGERTISIHSIEGVSVKSHPYKTMLGDATVKPPSLLKAVPADHLVLYVPKPAAILPFLNGGADFIASLGASSVGSSIRYELKDRYLARLGIDQTWLENVLKLGVVREFAIYAPDMFFIDGTDVTVISQIAQPALLSGILKMINIGSLGETVLPVKTQSGRDAFWAMKQGRLIVSTSRHEIKLALQLMDDPSASLAESVEYQYMLTQVPLQESTRMMLYFSDPFIRRLVSPTVKIGQRRRAFARASMEYVTAAALRANLDGVDVVDLSSLARSGYVPKGFDFGAIRLEQNGLAVSGTYGTLSDPVSLLDVPVDMVTADEAAAYRTYLENYNRFWRQFFDPIAMRIDDTPDGGLEMTTFILPLIDNSLYDTVKTLLVHADGPSLRVPTAKPDPVLMLSLNLAETAWTTVSQGFAEMFMRYIFLSPYAIDDLGPALHFAIYDADPVIALGSGDILGAFGGGMQIFRRGDMFAIPMALSVLTRPCAFMIETRDAARTARFLDEAASDALHRRNRGMREFSAEFYRVDNENSWVYNMSVMGMINLRFGITIEGDYVVIRNIPWSSEDRIVSVEESPLKTAALAVTPSACVEQLPGLHATAMEKAREASVQGIGRLYPLMLSRQLSVDEAIERHGELFGFFPVHPGENRWIGDARSLRSPLFGSAYRQQQPAYDPDDPGFGLFKRVVRLNVSMAFEDKGLRSVLQWKMKK